MIKRKSTYERIQGIRRPLQIPDDGIDTFFIETDLTVDELMEGKLSDDNYSGHFVISGWIRNFLSKRHAEKVSPNTNFVVGSLQNFGFEDLPLCTELCDDEFLKKWSLDNLESGMLQTLNPLEALFFTGRCGWKSQGAIDTHIFIPTTPHSFNPEEGLQFLAFQSLSQRYFLKKPSGTVTHLGLAYIQKDVQRFKLDFLMAFKFVP